MDIEIDYGDIFLNTAARQFIQLGVNNVTYESIVQECKGDSQAPPVEYKNLQDIVSAMAPIFFDARKKLCNSVNLPDNLAEEFVQIMKHCSDFFLFFSPQTVVLLRERYTYAFEIYEKHLKDVVLQKIEKNFITGIKQGEYQVDFNPIISAKLCLDQVQVAFDQLIFPNDIYNPWDVIRVITRNQLFAMCTDPKLSMSILNTY